MAAINMYGQYASPEDEYAALYGALNNPGANAGYSMPAFDPNSVYGQFTGYGGGGGLPSGFDPFAVSNGIYGVPGVSTGSNPGGGTGTNFDPQSGNPLLNPYGTSSANPNTVFTNPPPGTASTPPPTTTASPPAATPPALPPASNPTYPTGGANSLPMGSENIGGVGMYTGANAPLDTTRFDPQSNMDFVRNIDQVNYYKYVLPFQQRGGDITNPAAVRKAIEDGMRAAGGGQYAVGAQTFNVGGAQPTPNPPSQPVQYSGPQPPLPQQPQLNPAMAYRLPQVDPAMGRPQFQNPFGQVQNSFIQPSGYGGGQQYGIGQMSYPHSAQGMQPQQPYGGVRTELRGWEPGMPDYSLQGPNPYFGQNPFGQQPNQNMQLQQMIANAMARGVMGGGQLQGYNMGVLRPGDVGYPQSNQQYIQGNQYAVMQYGQQPQQQSSWSDDPGMNQARMFEMYGGGGGGGGALPQIDFRAATFGGPSQSSTQQTQAPSFTQQFSTPQTNTASASNPWSTLRNDRPSLSNNYNYMWGR